MLHWIVDVYPYSVAQEMIRTINLKSLSFSVMHIYSDNVWIFVLIAQDSVRV